MTIAFLCRAERWINEPAPEVCLQPGDDLYLFAADHQLTALVQLDLLGTAEDGAGAQREHVIVCGLGHVGYRIASILQDLGVEVTALDREKSRLAQRLASREGRAIIADFSRRTVLAEAGIELAQAIVVCSNDDMLNLETGLRARELKPEIRLVMRIFEDELGRRLGHTFDIDAVYSTSALAAPAFVGAALQLHLAQAVIIGDEKWVLTRFAIASESGLVGRTIQELNVEQELSVVLHASHDRLDIPPLPESQLRAGDEVVLLVSPDRLRQLSQRNRSLKPLPGR